MSLTELNENASNQNTKEKNKRAQNIQSESLLLNVDIFSSEFDDDENISEDPKTEKKIVKPEEKITETNEDLAIESSFEYFNLSVDEKDSKSDIYKSKQAFNDYMKQNKQIQNNKKALIVLNNYKQKNNKAPQLKCFTEFNSVKLNKENLKHKILDEQKYFEINIQNEANYQSSDKTFSRLSEHKIDLTERNSFELLFTDKKIVKRPNLMPTKNIFEIENK